MFIIFIILMVLLTAGAVGGWFLTKVEHDLGKPLMLGCSILVIVLTLGSLFFRKDNTPQYAYTAERFNTLSGEQMGRYLAENHFQQRVLILVRPYSEYMPLTPMEEALIEGLQNALRKDMLQVDVMAPPRPEAFQAQMEQMIKENPEAYPEGEADYLRSMPEVMLWFGPKVFSELVESKKYDYDIIVVTFDMPFDCAKLKIFKDPEAPKLAMINNTPSRVEQGMKDGLILAAVTHQPDREAWKDPSVPRNDQKAFDKRFLFLTLENMETVRTDYPSYFKY